MSKYVLVVVVLLCAIVTLGLAPLGHSVPLRAIPNHRKPIVTPKVQGEAVDAYPYHGSRFTQLVDDSYKAHGAGQVDDFYVWMEQAFQTSVKPVDGVTLDQFLVQQRTAIQQTTDSAQRIQKTLALAEQLHHMVREVIPGYSGWHGYEFWHVVDHKERQCLMQSVLIAGMLQAAGVDAGMVMVYKSVENKPSNNGHVVVVVKLPDGRDVFVDASYKPAVVLQHGIFARTSAGYRYVLPVYAPGANRVSRYTLASGRGALRAAAVRPLDYTFVRSQFYYYRGERADYGMFDEKPTPEGIQRSIDALRISITYCPTNPLAVYTLGRAYLLAKDKPAAREQLLRSQKLYQQFGWMPGDLPGYIKSASG